MGRRRTEPQAGQGRRHGCPVIGVDVDAAGLITLRRQGRPVSPKSPEDLADMAARVHGAGCKFMIKGVMTEDEARIAADAGVDAIVVSNHGGRVLDHTPGTAEVLPEIVKAVRGRVDVLADGGIRDGVDILKMLALGAQAGTCRPPLQHCRCRRGP